MPKYLKLAVLVAAALAASACTKKHAVYALTSTGSIIGFESNAPNKITTTVTVSGLASGESLVRFDYLPASGILYGLTNDNKLATIDVSTGAATLVNTTAFTTDSLSGAVISFDPVSGQLRVMSANDNLRVDPATATLIATNTAAAFDSGDTNSGKTPNLVGLAYNNQVTSATSTTLYALDTGTSSLVRVGDSGATTTASADTGDLHTIGPVGVSFNADAGFAIDRKDGTAYASLQNGSGAIFYTIDLGAGTAVEVGVVGDGSQTIIAIAIVPD